MIFFVVSPWFASKHPLETYPENSQRILLETIHETAPLCNQTFLRDSFYPRLFKKTKGVANL